MITTREVLLPKLYQQCVQCLARKARIDEAVTSVFPGPDPDKDVLIYANVECIPGLQSNIPMNIVLSIYTDVEIVDDAPVPVRKSKPTKKTFHVRAKCPGLIAE